MYASRTNGDSDDVDTVTLAVFEMWVGEINVFCIKANSEHRGLCQKDPLEKGLGAVAAAPRIYGALRFTYSTEQDSSDNALHTKLGPPSESRVRACPKTFGVNLRTYID